MGALPQLRNGGAPALCSPSGIASRHSVPEIRGGRQTGRRCDGQRTLSRYDRQAVWNEDPLEVALSVVDANFEAAEQELEARVTEWLAQDPEHWPIFCLVILDPWQEQPGRWREDVPGWVRTLGTNPSLAHFQQDPFGRQRVVTWNAIMRPSDTIEQNSK